MFVLRMETLLKQTHLNTKDTEHWSLPDGDHYTGRFWNLNLHEKHEGALHFWCRLFNRGSQIPIERTKSHYRVLSPDGSLQCYVVGLRFNK